MPPRAHWGGAFAFVGSDDLNSAERRKAWFKKKSEDDLDELPYTPRATDDPILPDDCVFPNMDELPELSEEAVLENLERLFAWPQSPRPGDGDPPCNNVYSCVGPVLIAMNPFTKLPIYGPEWVSAYRELGKTGRIDTAVRALGPHCYAMAEQAYQQLSKVPRQAIVICGESGAGKTVTNKLMLEYLLDADPVGGAPDASPKSAARDKRKRCVAEANLLIESFGNAPTVRNSNSSRFGKFSQLLLDNNNFTVKSFNIETTLLERSRVVFEPPGERNFFIFHQLVRSDLASGLGLDGGPEAFPYTRQGANAPRVDGGSFDDVSDFKQLCEKMETAGFSAESRQHIFEAVAAVLHLGNIEFDGDDDNSTVSPSSEACLKRVCDLLGFGEESAKSVADALTTLTSGGKVSITKTLGVSAARVQRDAFAKCLYAGIFADIIRQVNINVGQGTKSGAHIGLLDIFGFEDMPINSLEQMYINLTNERIQNLFNSIMFDREMKVYRSEGLEDAIDFEEDESNWPCIELFISGKSCKLGIVKMLADQCKVKAGRGDPDKIFLQNLTRNLKSGHPNFLPCVPGQDFNRAVRKKKKKWRNKLPVPDIHYDDCFQVRHYAGDVIYTITDFVSKSKDALPEQWADIFKTSSRPIVKGISDDAGDQSTVGDKLVEQLASLSQKLEQGDTHFVRCIKPNSETVPGIFNNVMVDEQLHCGGVFAALEMRSVGYPDRMDFDEFCDKFWILQSGWRRAGLESRRYCEELLQTSIVKDRSDYNMGHTKVFFKKGVLKQLRDQLHFRTQFYVVKAQRKFRICRGMQQMYVLETQWQKLQKYKSQVLSKGLTENQVVADAVQQADELILPRWEVLEKSKSEHEEKDEASMRLAIAQDLKQYSRNMPRLRHAVASVDEAIGGSLQERADGPRKKLQAKNKEMRALHKKFLALSEACGANPLPQDQRTWSVAPEFSKCVQAVRTAREKTEEMLMSSSGIAGRDSKEVEALFGKIQDRMDECANALSEMEDCEKQLRKVRKDFEKTASATITKQAKAAAKLATSQEEAAEASREGFDGMQEALDHAWQLDSIANVIANGAQDIPAFENSVEEFVLAVEEAETKVKLSLELYTRHQHKQAHAQRAALRALQAGPALCNAAEAFLLALTAVEKELSSKTDCGKAEDELKAKLQGLKDGVDALSAVWEPGHATPKLSEKSKRVSTPEASPALADDTSESSDSNDSDDDATPAAHAAPAAFEPAARVPAAPAAPSAPAAPPAAPAPPGAPAAPAAPASYDAVGVPPAPPSPTLPARSRREWKFTQSIKLKNASLEQLETLGKVISPEVNSVSLVVDGLNSGAISCTEKFCTAFSKRHNRWFLLFRRGQYEEACKALAVEGYQT